MISISINDLKIYVMSQDMTEQNNEMIAIMLQKIIGSSAPKTSHSFKHLNAQKGNVT